MAITSNSKLVIVGVMAIAAPSAGHPPFAGCGTSDHWDSERCGARRGPLAAAHLA